ncbi:MAG: hypothetical protein R3C13_04835 [Hyphomonas sp.]|uniref:hypothetical protein n=1 Tax=Hyphomonas sp. TaxID=87 RepID=UPI0035272890
MDIRISGLAVLVMALALGACQSSVQTSSGADYLARYDGSYEVAAGACGSDTDAEVRRIAAIEPDLRFPAKIGVARIGPYGDLVAVPANELEIWGELAEGIGPETGAFVPVSPMIAAMVSDSEPGAGSQARTIDHIRKGAARQHIDYVLVYETATKGKDRSNELWLADLTVLGLFVLPTRNVEVEATASGLLIDVRNGYPYATMTSFAEKKGLSRAIATWSKRQDLSATAEEKAVLELADDVRDALSQLKDAALDPPAEG